MTRVECYSAVYGDFDEERPQPVHIARFTDTTHPLPQYADSRLAAKWWKARPDLACPDAEVTVWLDGSFDVLVPDLAQRCLAALGEADAIFIRHPWRDCIYDEAEVSLHLAKYDGQPLLDQACAYRRAGHPEHWGLMHAGMLVRRASPAMDAVNRAWWDEIVRWSLQDQLSLPPLLRTMPVRFKWFEESPMDAGWVRWGRHREPDVWRP